MKRRITLHTFRKLEAAEEQMLRAVMPRASANDETPLVSAIRPAQPAARRAWRVPALTFTLQEVARG